MMRVFSLRLALGATPPVHDLGFVDFEAVIVIRCEAWHGADGAVDVDHGAALTTDQVVVVVADSGFVPGRRSSGLDPANQFLVDQHGHGVVHRLA